MSNPQETIPLLALKDINLSFSTSQILHRLSFDVQQGEICALIGPNGAGKSSVINIINGLYQPDQGQLFLRAIYSKAIGQKMRLISRSLEPFKTWLYSKKCLYLTMYWQAGF